LHCRAEFGREFIGLRQHADSVTTTLRGADGIEQIASRYVVGADGGASGVRKQLGIAFEGTTDERDLILIVDATVAGLARDRWHLWPGRGGFVGACPLPHGETFQWMIRLAADEEPPRDLAAIARRLLAATRDPRIELREIHWQSVFRPNIRLAARYRAERVFLAGDAAHVHTPAGAQGLNTGIQDACNLGWKLAQVLAGAPDRLLDTYEAERRPIAAGVLGLSTRRYEAIGRLAPAAIRRGKDERQLTLTYRGGPLAAGAAGSATLRAGDRAPDALLRDAAGRAVRLFDTFRGPHFSAIAYGPRAAAALDRLGWPTRGAALRRVVIDAPGQAGDHVLCDDGATFRRAYGVSQDALLIVRPDGHVAHLETRATPAAIAAVVTAAAAWAPVAGGEALTRS
jgi:2-polyprenyl-6-methoxyphenol hydroxylase-like FAD-dependent oxidoreductase